MNKALKTHPTYLPNGAIQCDASNLIPRNCRTVVHLEVLGQERTTSPLKNAVTTAPAGQTIVLWNVFPSNVRSHLAPVAVGHVADTWSACNPITVTNYCTGNGRCSCVYAEVISGNTGRLGVWENGNNLENINYKGSDGVNWVRDVQEQDDSEHGNS